MIHERPGPLGDPGLSNACRDGRDRAYEARTARAGRRRCRQGQDLGDLGPLGHARLGDERAVERAIDARLDGDLAFLEHFGNLRDHEEPGAVEHPLLAERQVLRLAQERQALEHVGHVVDRPATHLLRVVLESSFPVLLAVDLAVAEDSEQAIDFGVTNRAAQSDAVGVADGHEHHRLVRGNAEGVESARRAENGLLFDALDDAETVIRVDDLVTDLECHVSPVRGRVKSGGVRFRPATSIQQAVRNAKIFGRKSFGFAFASPSKGVPAGAGGWRLTGLLLCGHRFRAIY